MNGDNVNSIDETTESMQVAEIIRETYEELMSQRDWPHLKQMFKLEALSDSDYPTTFKIPDRVSYVDWIKYNKKESTSDADLFDEVYYKEPDDFIELLNSRRTTNSNVTVYEDNVSGIGLNIVTDQAPTFWTSFDNDHIIMDSFDSDVEATLQESKTQTFAVTNTEFSLADGHIPDLPEKMFPMLLAESKEVAMLNLRQVANQKEATRARRQNNTMQNRSHRQNNKSKWKAYGRRTI